MQNPHNTLSTTPHQTSIVIGQQAEADAKKFLEQHGCTFIEKNYCVRGGEIDLIMQHDDYLVFVEVKMRRNVQYGNPLDVIHQPKQSRIIHAAKCYLISRDLYDKAWCRFDAVCITPDKYNPAALKFTWIKNAFEVKY